MSTLKIRRNPEIQNKKPDPVSNEERDLVFEVADGVPEVIKLIGWIRMISEDTKDVKYMDMLRWLKRHKIKGWKVLELVQVRNKGSILETIAYIRKEVHSDFGIKKIYAKPL